MCCWILLRLDLRYFIAKPKNQVVHLPKNVWVVGKLFSGKNKMKRVLLLALLQRSINNVFLLSVRLTKQALHAVAVVRALKQPLTGTKHRLCRKIDR